MNAQTIAAPPLTLREASPLIAFLIVGGAVATAAAAVVAWPFAAAAGLAAGGLAHAVVEQDDPNSIIGEMFSEVFDAHRRRSYTVFLAAMGALAFGYAGLTAGAAISGDIKVDYGEPLGGISFVGSIYLGVGIGTAVGASVARGFRSAVDALTDLSAIVEDYMDKPLNIPETRKLDLTARPAPAPAG